MPAKSKFVEAFEDKEEQVGETWLLHGEKDYISTL